MNAIAPMPGWRLAAQVDLPALPADWRDALAQRLGQRPRRIGVWAELALYGACRCLDEAGEAALPPAARVRVWSLSGAQGAMRTGIGQVRAGLLPMPFHFMQGQPAMMLAALGQALGWRGDAAFVTGRDAQALLRLALAGAAPAGLLFGRVEEDGDRLRTAWQRWVPE
ncbi:hypothetical protein [Xenophilus azovorans]|uniref:hypothetical protein n=1 Tax=Xenophilus azovorans TaxID=151755 RepID=UPI00056DEBF7|nr:hypothetical protein [Xenophilus azovorans]